MLKPLLKDSVVYTAATVLSKGIQFLLLPLYTRLLSPVEYGLNDIITVYSTFITVIVSLEILQAVARFLPEQKTIEDKVAIGSAGLFFSLRNYAIVVILGQLLAARISILLTATTAATLTVRLALIAIFTNGAFLYLQAQLRWDLKSVDYSVASIIFVLISTGSSVIFIAGLRLGGSGVFAGQITGSLGGCLFCLIRNRTAFSIKSKKATLRALLAFSSPFVVSSVLAIGAQFADRLVMQRILDFQQLGVYGIAARFASVVSLLFVGFNMAISPYIYANSESAGLPKELARIFSAFLPLATLAACGSFIFSRELIEIMTSEAYHGAASVMPILVLSSIASNMYLLTPGMSISKNTGPIIFISAVSCLVGFGSNLILIPRFGINGAALSNLIMSTITFSLYYYFSQRYYQVPYEIRKVPVNLVIVVLVWAAIEIVDNKVSFAVVSYTIKVFLLAACGVMIWYINPALKSFMKLFSIKKR